MANQVGSVFFEDLKRMVNLHGGFRMASNFCDRNGERLIFKHINTLRVTKIKMVKEYERVFVQFLTNKIAHVTNQFDFQWLGADKDTNADDTVGYLTCYLNEDNYRCIKILDGETFGGKALACKPNSFCDNDINTSYRIYTVGQRSMVEAFNRENYTDLAINPDLRNWREPIQIFTSELRRRSRVEQLGAGENVNHTRPSIPSLLDVKVSKPSKENSIEKSSAQNVEEQERAAKRWKNDSSKVHVQSVGVETEKKDVRDQGIQTSASMEFRHPDFAWYNS